MFYKKIVTLIHRSNQGNRGYGFNHNVYRIQLVMQRRIKNYSNCIYKQEANCCAYFKDDSSIAQAGSSFRCCSKIC